VDLFQRLGVLGRQEWELVRVEDREPIARIEGIIERKPDVDAQNLAGYQDGDDSAFLYWRWASACPLWSFLKSAFTFLAILR
jgi:hypothetical protein